MLPVPTCDLHTEMMCLSFEKFWARFAVIEVN
jgi:hypothetical protein